MSLWSRIKGFFGRTPKSAPPPPYVPPPISDVPPSPPIPRSPYDGGGYFVPQQDQYTLIDDWGINRGTDTQQGWYEATLLDGASFHARFGDDFDNIDLIDWYEEQFDEPWDWETWRELYRNLTGE